MTGLQRTRGFTLVEMLVAASLMALVAGTTVAALNGGLSVWERASGVSRHEEAALITFSQLRRDLHNARRFSPIRFDGSYDAFTFAAAEASGDNPEGIAELGQLGYHVNGRHHTLCRTFVPYRRLRRARMRDQCHAVLGEIQKIRAAYFNGAGWQERWEEEELPLAVKLAVTSESGETNTFVVSMAHLARPAEAP